MLIIRCYFRNHLSDTFIIHILYHSILLKSHTFGKSIQNIFIVLKRIKLWRMVSATNLQKKAMKFRAFSILISEHLISWFDQEISYHYFSLVLLFNFLNVMYQLTLYMS